MLGLEKTISPITSNLASYEVFSKTETTGDVRPSDPVSTDNSSSL